MAFPIWFVPTPSCRGSAGDRRWWHSPTRPKVWLVGWLVRGKGRVSGWPRLHCVRVTFLPALIRLRGLETVSFIVRPDAGLTADPPWAELPGGATQTVDLYFSTRAIAPTKVVVWSAEEALGDRIASIIEWERLGDRGTLGTLELYTIGYSGPSRRPLPSSATATATATPTGVPAATTSAGGMAFSSTGVPIPARAVGTGVRASELNVVSADGPTFSVRPGQVIDFATPTEEQSIYIKETSGGSVVVANLCGCWLALGFVAC